MARATVSSARTTALVIAHTMLALPFVVLNVGVSLDGLDRRLLLAAAGLGAGDFLIFRTVTLPLILPGVVGGAVFAFVTSFDEVVLSIFLAGPDRQDAAGAHLGGDTARLHARRRRRCDGDARCSRSARRPRTGCCVGSEPRERGPVRRHQQVVRRRHRPAPDRSRHPAGRIPDAARPLRIGQDDAPQHLRRIPLRLPRAVSSSAAATSPHCRRGSAKWGWCSRTTRCFRT